MRKRGANKSEEDKSHVISLGTPRPGARSQNELLRAPCFEKLNTEVTEGLSDLRV
jgi:hypothetical protein